MWAHKSKGIHIIIHWYDAFLTLSVPFPKTFDHKINHVTWLFMLTDTIMQRALRFASSRVTNEPGKRNHRSRHVSAIQGLTIQILESVHVQFHTFNLNQRKKTCMAYSPVEIGPALVMGWLIRTRPKIWRITAHQICFFSTRTLLFALLLPTIITLPLYPRPGQTFIRCFSPNIFISSMRSTPPSWLIHVHPYIVRGGWFNTVWRIRGTRERIMEISLIRQTSVAAHSSRESYKETMIASYRKQSLY